MDPIPDKKRTDQGQQGDLACLQSCAGKLEHLASELLRLLGPEEEDLGLGLSWRVYPNICSRTIIIGEQAREREEPDQLFPISDILIQVGEGIGRVELVVSGVDPRQQIFKLQQLGPRLERICVYDSASTDVPSIAELGMLLTCLQEAEVALFHCLEDVKKWHPNAES
jgi:hypothetical protein